MKIAVITGASSGIGKDFARQAEKLYTLDELWIIGRSSEKLSKLVTELSTPARIIECDLMSAAGTEKYKQLLDEHTPEVKLLVNSAGFGKFGRYDEIPLADSLGMIDLNCRALAEMTLLTLPYMDRGSDIIQMASLSSYQPVPYLNIYGATKAFVLSFSRALNVELKPRGIRVLAVSPGWVRTMFFDRAETTSRTAITYFNKFYLPADVANKAFRDLQRGRDVSILGLPVRMQIRAVKLLPHRLVMGIWMKQQKHG